MCGPESVNSHVLAPRAVKVTDPCRWTKTGQEATISPLMVSAAVSTLTTTH